MNELAVFVHIVVVLLVVTGGDVIEPLLVIEVPTDGFLDAFFELERGFPAEFALEFGGVDSIAHIVSGTVGNVRNEVQISSFWTTKQTIHGSDDGLDDVDILPFVESADIIGISNLTLMEDEIMARAWSTT